MMAGAMMQNFREGEYVHVSDLIYKCVRRTALSHKLRVPMPSERIMDSKAITFAQGDAVHDFVKGRVVRNHPDQVYGGWRCACKATSRVGVYADVHEEKCAICDSALEDYVEMQLKDEEFKIVGNVDLSLLIGQAFYLNEIKSIARKGWEELEAPKPEHVIQVLFYWWLARRNYLSLFDKVSILFVNKDFIFNSPYKEYILRPSIMVDRLEDYLEDAQSLAHYRETKELPPRIQCATPKAKDAKSCHVCDECFAID